MFLASSSVLPLWTCLRVEKVALVQMRKMGLEGDMTLAGFLTLALKSCVMKAFCLVPPPVTVLTGLLCPEASAPGLGSVPLGGRHLMIVL